MQRFARTNDVCDIVRSRKPLQNPGGLRIERPVERDLDERCVVFDHFLHGIHSDLLRLGAKRRAAAADSGFEPGLLALELRNFGVVLGTLPRGRSFEHQARKAGPGGGKAVKQLAIRRNQSRTQRFDAVARWHRARGPFGEAQ